MQTKREAYPGDVREHAVRRMRDGASTREVARELGISPTTTWRWLQVELRKGGRAAPGGVTVTPSVTLR